MNIEEMRKLVRWMICLIQFDNDAEEEVGVVLHVGARSVFFVGINEETMGDEKVGAFFDWIPPERIIKVIGGLHQDGAIINNKGVFNGHLDDIEKLTASMRLLV